MNPKVSMLVPAFKDSYLSQSINSLLSQTYDNFSITVVDDASPNNIECIVKSFSSDRLKYYRNPQNIGGHNLVANWNSMLKYAEDADLVVLASDDDIYHPAFLSTLVNLSLKYPSVDLFHCRVGVIDGQNNPIHWGASIAEFESDIDFIYQRAVNRRTQLISDFMFRRTALMNIGGFTDYPKAWHSDEMTVYKIARGKGVVCSQETLFFWRSSNQNISSRISDLKEKAIATDLHRSEMREFIKSLVPHTQRDEFLHQQLKARCSQEIERQLIYDMLKAPFFKALAIFKKYPYLRTSKWMLKFTEGHIRRLLGT